MFSKILKYSLLLLYFSTATQAAKFGYKDQLRQAKAQEVQAYMNASIDPCADFYEFTCGNYEQHRWYYAEPTMTMPSLGTTKSVVSAKHRQELETYNEMDTAVERKVKNFYRSCLNATPTTYSIERRRDFLKQFGQMPVLEGDDWQEEFFEWTDTVAEIFYRTSLPLIIGISIINDFADNATNAVHISPSPFVEEKYRFYANREYAAERRKEIDNVRFVLAYSLGIEGRLAARTAREIVDFKIALALGINETNKSTPTPSKMDTSPLTSLEEMLEKYLPDFNTREFLGAALDFVPPQLYVQHEYLANALNIIKYTPKRIVANYIFYHYFSMFPFQFQMDQELKRSLCADDTQRRFYKTLDNIFYRKYITPQMEEAVKDMWSEIKASFQAVLQSPNLNWLQEDTRRLALEKLNAMRLRLVTDVDADVNSDEDLDDLDISEDDYLQNIATLLTLRGNRTRASLYLPPKPVVWPTVSPTYSRTENAVIMPLVYVQQYHRYASAYPNAYKFATLGFVLGHEMHHGFDAARRYDSEGFIRDWWDPKSDQQYLRREQCFIDQYKRYAMDGRPLPEMKYQAENIADIGGLTVAYAAYTKWLRRMVQTKQPLDGESLTNIDYNGKQLFFISYSQWWCKSYQLDYDAMKVAAHVPPKFRVIGPLSNFPEFAKVFECTARAPMNPRRKCQMY